MAAILAFLRRLNLALPLDILLAAVLFLLLAGRQNG